MSDQLDHQHEAGNDNNNNNNMAVFTSRVYEITHSIPQGRVTTYKHIAILSGFPNHSRHVGNAMRDLPPNSTVPWQRVISSAGFISPRGDGGLSVQRQRDALIAEGVEVITVAGGGTSIDARGGGKEKVDLKRYGWFPESRRG